MKAQIRVVGIGHRGCRLLDGVIACGLRKEREDNELPTIADIRYVAVETDIGTLNCSNADVGFFFGTGLDQDGGTDVHERRKTQIAAIIEHVIHDAHLLLIMTGLDDPMECNAATAVATMGREKNIMTISFVTYPTNAAQGTKSIAHELASIRSNSDALYEFPAEAHTFLGNTALSPNETNATPADNLIHCANVLAKFIYQPHQTLVGFDFQDLRTALLGCSEVFRTLPHPPVHARHHYLRWVASLDTPPAKLAAAAIESLPLKDASTVLICIEAGPKFSMPRLRDLLTPIIAGTQDKTFVKYFVDVDPCLPADALAAHLYIRTEYVVPDIEPVA